MVEKAEQTQKVKLGFLHRKGIQAAMLLAVLFAGVPAVQSESLASKNKKGNRLYSEGKFEEAEKVYLDAQVKNPGKPEIIYNLGNSLIKQKKHEEGIRTLRQAIDKGDKALQEKSWYNIGNGFFSMGNYKDSAGAYIQALKLNPGDTEAKHNLELALLRMKSSQQSADSRQQSKEKEKQKDQQTENNQKQQANNEQEKKEEKQKQAQMKEGTLTKEQALQLLDAVQNQEQKEKRRLLERQAKEITNGKDW
jgi:Ca-activated chloride channel homolog